LSSVILTIRVDAARVGGRDIIRLWSDRVLSPKCYHAYAMEITEPHSVPLPQPAVRRAFEHVSLSRQFLLVGATLLLSGMAVVGSWLGMEIEHSAVNRAAAVSAIYVESILAAQLRQSSGDAMTSIAMHEALDRIFIAGPLRRKVVRFKLWDSDGAILYSSDHSQSGAHYLVNEHLAAAFAGKVQAHLSPLDKQDNLAEREQWKRLIEVYVPVRSDPQGPIVAVAEFYHATDNIDREIRSAQQRSWALVIVATGAMLLLLVGTVRRVDDTLLRQRDDLRRQLDQLQAAFAENERMRARLGEAGAATTALNERFLHRIAADLHDGPAQTLAFALMRFDELAGACGACNNASSPASPNLPVIQGALRASLDDLRNIAAGLGVPGIAELTLAETARRAVRDVERQAGVKIEARIGEIPGTASLATKITAYRLLQESLSNSHRHAPGGAPTVRMWHDNHQVRIDVSDCGAGFDPELAARAGRLGLAFMQERVRLLGGTIEIESAPGHGTRVLAGLPLSCQEAP
jgi:signal transduction histidine kinase